MGNGDNLDALAAELLSHSAKDDDTQLLMKGMSMIVQNQKSLPCEGHEKAIRSLKKFHYKALGAIAAIAAVASGIGLLIAFIK